MPRLVVWFQVLVLMALMGFLAVLGGFGGAGDHDLVSEKLLRCFGLS